ncbi:hypothetical protein [Flagellimonas zhangzhouensis]|uniref:GLPGLI family protein n=1 Tax=Flagellimonas zhangzhouensis TaxID=1073328 RepID=A0A1H2RQ13_9FLAO|nr:hypothetical protein [Allomuricauda zhangzhouensis]SDQ66394.1 hypothetical protein SAMN05216294_2103 [Allomuricauda zhangzhouensis]SDW21427.1 hypothetical protein SAMN04487892_0751 [Allomuricauda zhangzhouensis]
MKVLLRLFAFFVFTFGYSQKTYVFDQLATYEVIHFKDSIQIKNRTFIDQDITYKKVYLTNSRDNSYLCILKELDNGLYLLDFKDYRGVTFNVSVSKSDFEASSFLTIACKLISSYINPYTEQQTKNYEFVQLKDTSINKTPYYRYKLTSNKSKRKKRLKLGEEFYLIDKNTTNQPPTLDFSTAYEEWKTTKEFQNGMLFEKHFIDYYGNLDSKERLLNIQKIKKEIRISTDCIITKYL